MTVAMPDRTTDPWGIRDQMFVPAFSRTAPSTMNFHIVDQRIAGVLGEWVGIDADEPDDIAAAEAEYPQSPVEAVRFLTQVLQISQDRVLNAVNVAERSFFQWAAGTVTSPRAASLGRLWPMVEAIAPLRAAHPSLAAWFHSTPSAQEAFAAGHINDLLRIEFDWAAANTRRLVMRPVGSFGDPADNEADTNDVEPDDVRVPKPSIRRRPRSRVRRERPE